MFTLSEDLLKQQNDDLEQVEEAGSLSTVSTQPGILAKQVDQLFGSDFDTETLFEEGTDPLYNDIQRPSFKSDFTFNETQDQTTGVVTEIDAPEILT